MSEQKNNIKKLTKNQLDTNKSTNQKNNKIKKVEKLQPKLFKEPSGFVQISNDTLNGIDDAEVLGVYCYLAGRPPEWIICKAHLRNRFKVGINKINSIFTKLRYLGLLELIATKDEDGKIKSWDYYLKNHINISEKTTRMDSIAMDSISMENYPPINKENINKENINIKEKIYKKESDFEISEVIEKAQECLDNTRTNLPSVIGEVKDVDYQDTNFPSTKKQNPLQELQLLNSLGLPTEFLEKFLEIRKANKASNNKHALKAAYEELVLLHTKGYDLDVCLKIYANASWKGFFAGWVINTIENNKPKSGKLGHSEDTSWINNLDLSKYE